MKIGRPLSKRISVGDVFESTNYGKFKVKRVGSAVDIDVEFLLTGYITNVQASKIDSGAIKDPMFPCMHGVGFFGVGKYNSKSHKSAYQKWKNMLARCYSGDYQKKNPSYIGCSVADEWHNFQNFAKWLDDNGAMSLDYYEIDKDELSVDKKIYSPETCQITSGQRNVEIAHAGSFRFVDPDGNIHDVYNLSKFCRENNLSQGHMSSVSSGLRSHHKGWKSA